MLRQPPTRPPGAEAEEIERKATVTNDQLDEMLTNDLNTVGYTREYFVQNQTASVQRERFANTRLRMSK